MAITDVETALRAGHRSPSLVMVTTSPWALRASTSASFWCGLMRPQHADLLHLVGQLLGWHLCQLVAGDHAVVGDARLGGNGARGAGVVAGDHHHANARLAALRNGLGHLGAQRVCQGHQAQPFKVKVQLGVGPGVLRAVLGLGCAQHPQSPGRPGVRPGR